MSARELTSALIAEARRLGFARVGIVPIEASRRHEAYEEWLARGDHGTMAYMAAPAHRAGRADLRELLAEAKSAVVVAMAYSPSAGAEEVGDALRGEVASYARGDDYHYVLKERLRRLASFAAERADRPVASRVCVDTAPVLERELAERAGIGFVAKNTMLISPGLGSFTLLGELLLDLELDASPAEPRAQRCGSCRSCLDACPTQAFRGPFVLDARRCVSYLTIEHKGSIPIELRPKVGSMIFGCDICQRVCPFNARAPERAEIVAELLPRKPDRGVPELIELAALGANQRRRYLEKSAMRRINREQLLRNVAVALGNSADERARPTLETLSEDASEIVREHAAWALSRLGGEEGAS